MIKIAMRAALILSMLFVSTGSTVVVEAQSLPDTVFVSHKVAVEQVLHDRETGVEGKATRQLVMAQERVREIIRLSEQGEFPGEEVQTRLKVHLQLAMQNAAQLGDGEMLGLLNWIQSMVQTQLQLLNQARERIGEQAEGTLGQAIQTMEQVQAQVQAGLQDPNEFRLRARNGQLDELLAKDIVTTSAEPISIGDEHKYGPQPDQPGPGQPGGNPDCPLDGCEPVGDAHQYGPQPEQPGPGQPGGNPDCVDCVPAGDQNMNGEPPADPGNGGAASPGGSGGR